MVSASAGQTYLAAGQSTWLLTHVMDNRAGATLRNTIGAGPFGRVDGRLGRRRK